MLGGGSVRPLGWHRYRSRHDASCPRRQQASRHPSIPEWSRSGGRFRRECAALRAWRSPLSSFSCIAISAARASSFSVKRSMTRSARSMRPAALRRGATRNAMSPALSGREPSSWQLASRARSPALRGLRSPCRPSLAKTRFSPTSGTASAMVAMATIFRNDGRRLLRPAPSSSACAILKATPAPQSDLQGYSQPCWLGLTTASAFGRPSACGQVMVGDDEIDATALGCFGGGKGANASVDADDQPDARGCRLLDDFVAHAVAFADAVRHVVLDLAAADFERGLEDHDGGGAVDVVVAIDKDGFTALDGGTQAFDCGAQSRHEVGRVEMRQRGRQEFLRLFRCGDAARCE